MSDLVTDLADRLATAGGFDQVIVVAIRYHGGVVKVHAHGSTERLHIDAQQIGRVVHRAAYAEVTRQIFFKEAHR